MQSGVRNTVEVIDKVGDLDTLICYGKYQNKTSGVNRFPNFGLTIQLPYPLIKLSDVSPKSKGKKKKDKKRRTLPKIMRVGLKVCES